MHNRKANVVITVLNAEASEKFKSVALLLRVSEKSSEP